MSELTSTDRSLGTAPGSRRSSGVPLLHLALLLVGGALWGGLLGVIWEWAWTPPTGAAFEGRWLLDPRGVKDAADGTVWFTLIGLVGGLVYGLLGSWRAHGRELLVLAGVLVGSVVAAWVMFHVGRSLGPPDPESLAAVAGDLEPIVGDLDLAGTGSRPWPLWFESSAFVALPAGAMMGVVASFLGGSGSRRSYRSTQ